MQPQISAVELRFLRITSYELRISALIPHYQRKSASGFSDGYCYKCRK